MANVQSLLRSTITRLEGTGIPTAKLDAEVLLAHALGCERAELYLYRDRCPTEKELGTFEEYIARRLKREPVAYIRGFREFWSIPIRVTPSVLIPRPETELVVERVLKVVGDKADRLDILDICTGSGCIAAALAKELPKARFVVTEASSEAIDVAKQNLSFAIDRVELLIGDLFCALKQQNKDPTGHWSPVTGHGTFDIITANPPYISDDEMRHLDGDILDHEPKAALAGGNSGLDFIARIIEDAPVYLKEGAWLVMEMGLGQADEIKRLAAEVGEYEKAIISKDLAGVERVISLCKSSS